MCGVALVNSAPPRPCLPCGRAKYPELYGGAYGIKPEILDHEVNKFSQCDNTHAREVYGWQPQVDIETGLGRVIEAETRMLAGLEK